MTKRYYQILRSAALLLALLFSVNFMNAQNECNGTLVVLQYSPGTFENEVSWDILAPDGEILLTGDGYSSTYTLCLEEDGCYTVSMYDSFGDGWNGGTLTIYNLNSVAGQFSMYYGSYEVGAFGINATDCVGISFGGCTDPGANNYDSEATYNDGSCEYSGCTDPAAINYNYLATTDDGSCEYCDGEGSVTATLYVCAFGNGNEIALQIVDDQGNEIVSVANMNNYGIVYYSICLSPNTCYTALMSNALGNNGWYGGYFWINDGNGTQIINTSLPANASSASAEFSIDGTCGPVTGCTDPNASNYNPEAQMNDGSCLYGGCTDPTALNYDWSANFDDGSCEYCDGEGSVTATLYVCAFGNGAEIGLQIVDAEGNEVASVSGLNDYGIAYLSICLQPGTCYTAIMTNVAGNTGWYGGYFWINNNGNGQYINSYLPEGLTTSSVEFSIDGTCGPTYGCTDPSATNYDPNATANDGSCIYPIYGCTDPAALNYWEWATEDDGSCTYPEDCLQNSVVFTLSGGIFPGEISYSVYGEDGTWYAAGYSGSNAFACLSDGCYLIDMYDSFGDGWNEGYLDVYVNGVLTATVSIESGSYGIASFGVNTEGCTPSIAGCTDPAAFNYNYLATEDDGSCIYAEDCESNLVQVTLMTDVWGSEISWSLVDENGVVAASGGGYDSWSTYTEFLCLADGCYTLVMEDSWGDGWNGAYIYFSGLNAYGYGSLYYGDYGTISVAVNSSCTEVSGCMDPGALNYNPLATSDDGSCVYDDNDGFNGDGFQGLELDLELYPNPTNGGMVLNAGNLNAFEPIVIDIVNITGQNVRSVSIANDQPFRKLDMDVTDLAGGYYMLKLTNGGNVVTSQFVKE